MHNFNRKKRADKQERLPFFVDVRGSSRNARLGKPDIPRRRNRFEIDPDLEPAATADMRNDKGKGDSDYEVSDDLGDLHICLRSPQLVKKALDIVRLLCEDADLEQVRPVPGYIPCGQLRRSVRSVFGSALTLAQELSIKTSQKCEVRYCDHCEVLAELQMENWKEKRRRPVCVDIEHLDSFSRAFSSNVPAGWDRRKSAYVPNGHACLGSSRMEGGNWRADVYSPFCDVMSVVSSGKPRVVTLYSERNVAVLTPLHNSLYTYLRRRGWLLVGSPTEERLREAFSEMPGKEWLSFDYESATDNIKTAYVQRAVEELIKKASGLSEEEVLCLRTMANLNLGGEMATTGQPMGSPMSFPLLCLINKTVVDMALTQLLLSKEIEFKEWTRHRCLINGDDLLLKDTTSGTLATAIEEQGRMVGLVTNREKTLRSVDTAEINSTAFVAGVLQKKTNVSALWMGAEVENVIDFARESCQKFKSVVGVVSANANRLAKSKQKVTQAHPWELKKALLRSKRVRAALVSGAAEVPQPTNLFPVETVPCGFKLSYEEMNCALDREVERIRERKLWLTALASRTRRTGLVRQRKAELKMPATNRAAVRALRYKKKRVDEEVTLSIFVKEWKRKEWTALAAESYEQVSVEPVHDCSRVQWILDEIKAFKDKRNLRTEKQPDPFVDTGYGNTGFVGLSDG